MFAIKQRYKHAPKDTHRGTYKQLCALVLQAGRLEELYKVDQLYQQRMLGNVFAGYKETRPAFWPTYKYDLVHVYAGAGI